MSDRIQRVMAYVIAMAMVTAVAAAPTLAQVFDPEAERVFEVTANADTVDGFSAIGATANKALRARKLVATNRYGQLPSNIIRPRWRELKGVPAGFKDGVDDVGFSTYVHTETFTVGNTPKSVGITYHDAWAVDTEILPVNVGDEVIVIERTSKRTGDGLITQWHLVQRHTSSSSATVPFRIRVRGFQTDLGQMASLATSQRSLRDQIKVKVVRSR